MVALERWIIRLLIVLNKINLFMLIYLLVRVMCSLAGIRDLVAMEKPLQINLLLRA